MTVPSSVRPRPLLMIPVRRCGSHALRLRLNASPYFHSPYPLHIVDFMPLVPRYGDLAHDDHYFRMVVDVVGLQAALMVKWPGMAFDPCEIFEAVRGEPRSVHRIVWEMLLRSGEAHGARVVMDKSLDSVHYAGELMELLPDMLFLNVVRDPRAQVASMNRAIIHDFDTALNALTWSKAHSAGRDLASTYPDRVLTIRYEDFLADQEATLRRICAFAGLEFLDAMLDIGRSEEARSLSRMSDLWSSNCFPPIAANRDKFKTQLSAGELELIETIAADHMRHYGYEFMTPAAAPRMDPDALAASVLRSTQGRTLAWEALARDNPRDHYLRRFRADYLARLHEGSRASSDARDARRDAELRT
jgi:hypothetical protein